MKYQTTTDLLPTLLRHMSWFTLLAALLMFGLANGTVHAQGKGNAPGQNKGGDGDDGEPPPDSNAGIRYDLQYLGILPGGTWSFATALNDSGEVVGQSDTDELAKGFYWFDGQMVPLESLVDPERPLFIQMASDVNNAGQIVATGRVVESTGFGPQVVFRLTPPREEESYYRVDVIGENIYFRSPRLNNDGDVIGYHDKENEGWQAFVWTEEGGFVDLGQFDGKSDTFPRAIRDRIWIDDMSVLEIVGDDRSGTLGSVAWRATYSPPGGGHGGSVYFQDLGYLASHSRTAGASKALGINSSGVIVGQTTTGRDQWRAARYTDNGGWENLGTLAPSNNSATSIAHAVNEAGAIVGRSGTGDPGQPRSFLYHDDFGMVVLEDLISNLPAAFLGNLNPAGINDFWEICGPNEDNYTGIEGTQAYILVPQIVAE